MTFLKREKKVWVIVSLFLIFSAWWGVIQINDITNENYGLDYFAGTYGVLALVGGLFGLSISRKWGGYKSVIGRSILMFSLGLLAQEFGQLVYAYYTVVDKIEIPYPSLGDIGYFGSVLFYIYGTILLAQASGVKVSLRSLANKVQAFLIPAVLLLVSYRMFLQDYEADWSNPLVVILDFGYPLGQAIYISIAILAYLLSRKLLGGIMRNKILLIILALCAQYAADFNFLFQISRETWATAGYGDYLYLTAYLIMALAILGTGWAYRQIREQQ